MAENTPTKSKAAAEAGYQDVSKDVEQARADAVAPIELDADGQPKVAFSEAAAAVAEENSRRSSGQANGGGPWPAELLVQVGTTAGRRRNLVPEYTSHLSEKEQEALANA